VSPAQKGVHGRRSDEVANGHVAEACREWRVSRIGTARYGGWGRARTAWIGEEWR
jgi:hypothetical protein